MSAFHTLGPLAFALCPLAFALCPLALALCPLALLGQPAAPPSVLPQPAVTQLAQSLESSKPHRQHIWRDTPPVNGDRTVNGYIEIARGDRRKWEFDMRRNQRAIDRVIPPGIGGYPVNYGFVPQTVSYDGDPFDILVLGPTIEGGTAVRGVAVGLMHMEDEKGLDSKVVVSVVGKGGQPVHTLTDEDQRRIGDFFNRYKSHEPGKFSKVYGWGTPAQGLEYVRMTHAFFEKCRNVTAQPCKLEPN